MQAGRIVCDYIKCLMHVTVGGSLTNPTIKGQAVHGGGINQPTQHQ